MNFNYFVDDNIPTNKMPAYQTQGSAGFDLIYYNCEDHCIEDDISIIIRPGEIATLNTGFAITAMSEDLYLDIRPRSSLTKRGLFFYGSGVIDSDFLYPNRILVPVKNSSSNPVTIERFDRIAQALIIPIIRINIPILDTTREGGFGSTGK